MQPATDSKLLLLVVGSGRSGTSLLSGVMQRLGFYVPQPEVPPDETNPTGFFEPQWVVDFHTKLLRKVAAQSTDARPAAWSTTGDVAYSARHRQVLRSWLAEQVQASDHVLVKDPRLLWFIPLWHRAAEDLGIEVRFATMLRSPSEVVASKERWYASLTNPANRLAGWVNTMLYTERATRRFRRAFVLFDELVLDWTRTVAHLDERLGLGVVPAVGTRQMQDVAQLIDPRLRRSLETWDQLDVPKALLELAERVWADLIRLADGSEPDGRVAARLDAARDEYRNFYADCEAVAFSSVRAAHQLARRR